MKTPPMVLIVDDEEANRDLIEAILLPKGYDTEMACDGKEALEKVDSEKPDLILLDVMMPDIDGFEVAEKLKNDPVKRIIPIIMVTALTEVENRVRAMEIGVDDFLTKPVEKAMLITRVKSLLKVKAYNDHMINYQRELEQEVAKRTRELKKAFEKIKNLSLDTIYRLSRTAEYRDEDTGEHLKRMSHYSAEVAKKLGVDETVTETILYASPMHDVGKVGIPDRILLKPGKLDPEEWEIMKSHTTIGGNILEGAKEGFIALAHVIAMTHHEKFDGTGYPRGLAGRNIPLVGRITAIADVYDALTSERPYKNAFPHEKAIDIIRQGRGNHFDPEVVDAFFAIEEKVLAIREKYRDRQESHLRRTDGVLTAGVKNTK